MPARPIRVPRRLERTMTQLRFNISMSLDGFVAGPDQSVEDPLGMGGERAARMGLRARRLARGARHARAARSTTSTRVSRNVGERRRHDHGPQHVRRRIRAPGATMPWNGWWGDDPPFHHPVFVLTHHARAPLAMRGRHDVPLRHRRDRGGARAGAGTPPAEDVMIAGGAEAAQQYLAGPSTRWR